MISCSIKYKKSRKPIYSNQNTIKIILNTLSHFHNKTCHQIAIKTSISPTRDIISEPSTNLTQNKTSNTDNFTPKLTTFAFLTFNSLDTISTLLKTFSQHNKKYSSKCSTKNAMSTNSSVTYQHKFNNLNSSHLKILAKNDSICKNKF